MIQPILESTLTSPKCAYQRHETMPTDSCRYYYECESCHALLQPDPGDCCVFCSLGTIPCPPRQGSGGRVEERRRQTRHGDHDHGGLRAGARPRRSK